MTAKKNWKLDWYDAVAADKRVDPAAFKVAYCMRRNLLRRTFAARVDDKVLSKMAGISVPEVNEHSKCSSVAARSVSGSSQMLIPSWAIIWPSSGMPISARTTPQPRRVSGGGLSITFIGQQRWLDQRQCQSHV